MLSVGGAIGSAAVVNALGVTPLAEVVGSATPPTDSLTPAQIRSAYGIDAITLGSVVGDGTGQTIAIVVPYDNPKFVNSTDADFLTSDLHLFDVQYGLADPPIFEKVGQDGSTTLPAAAALDSGFGVETAIDVEWAHAIAPKANILLVEANSDSLNDILQAVDTARNRAGVSVISLSFGLTEATIDEDGGAGHELSLDHWFTTPDGHQGVTVIAATGDNGSPGMYPAFSPNVLAVGGTTLTVSGDTYVSEMAWSSSGGGQSLHELQPDFQSGVQDSGFRQTPDVAFVADAASGIVVYDSYDFGDSTPWAAIGGTSLATPCWAGLVAIANQLRVSTGEGTLDGPSETIPGIYALPSRDFHDIVTGDNGTDSATARYDLVTGLGTPVANLLVPDLATLTTAAQPVATVSLNTATAKLHDVLTATATKSDPDGEPVSLTFVWKVGTVVERTFTSATELTDTFELIADYGPAAYTVTVSVTPNNTKVDGTTVTASASVAEILAPVATVELNNHTPTADDVLIATATKSDPQGEPVSLTFEWWVNGEVKQSTTSATDLTSTFDLSTLGFGTVNFTVYAVVTPDNGSLEGEVVYDSATIEGLHDFSTIGAYDPSTSIFYLRNSNDAGAADLTFAYGPAGGHWLPIVGDWNGDGTDTIGLYNPVTSVFYLRNSNTAGYADIMFIYGPAGGGWKPMVGDWNGDGKDTIGLYDPTLSRFYLRNSNTTGYANLMFDYGPAGGGWRPITGDWDGDGTTTIGMYDPGNSTFYLRDSNTAGFADTQFNYGLPNGGYIPIVGDWDGNGTDVDGLYEGGIATYYLKDTFDGNGTDLYFTYGIATTVRRTAANTNWIPLAGDWNGRVPALQAASGSIDASPTTTAISEAALKPLVSEALARWAASGLSASSMSVLSSVHVAVRDLPGSTLALADGNTIYIDRDAAGHGWFVDSTPAQDEEFAAVAGSPQLQAVDPRAVDRIDLLSVVEHELGHVAGFEDLDPSVETLMGGFLNTGVRRNVD